MSENQEKSNSALEEMPKAESGAIDEKKVKPLTEYDKTLMHVMIDNVRMSWDEIVRDNNMASDW